MVLRGQILELNIYPGMFLVNYDEVNKMLHSEVFEEAPDNLR